MFAPTLFIGAMLGGAVGSIEHHWFPSLTGTVGTFALIGMGTFFAGFLRTPITSVFMVMEVSGNYTSVLPVMVASLVAYSISRRYQRVPLFDLLARQDGVLLPSIEEQREQKSLTVEGAMQYDAGIVALPGETIAEIIPRGEPKPGAPILLRGRAGEWHLVDRENLTQLAAADSGHLPVAQVSAKGPLPIIFRDQSLEDALHALGDWPILLVVSRVDLSSLEGVLTLADILRAFRNASAE
jgi:CIC family chloride channel protein